MLKIARLICDHGHEWLSLDFDSREHPDAWGIDSLGSLAARLEPDPQTGFTVCASCGSTIWRIEIQPRVRGRETGE